MTYRELSAVEGVLTPDICVIGAGSAGLAVAAAAAAFGVSVVLVEKDRMGGGLDAGPIPLKALIAAARHVRLTAEGRDFGIRAGEPEVDFPAVMAHVRRAVAAVEPNGSAERMTGLGVTVLRGEARFTDPQGVMVGGAEIRARRIVVATGSRPAIPPISNIEAVPYLTDETIFDLGRLPGHLVVIGASATGLEMAQAFRRLGSQVTVLEADRALAGDDPELTALLVETLRAEGIDIREGVRVARVARRGRSGVRVTLNEEGSGLFVDGTHLLVATGRRPAVEGLGLEQARIAFDARGIKVNQRLRTRNRHVYAVGDVADGAQYKHGVGYQADLVLRSILFRFGGKVRPERVSRVAFTDPELSHAGLTEAEARRRRRDVQVLRWPFSENDRAQAERATRGLVKVIVDRNGRILGAGVLGRDAGELIAPYVVAIAAGLSVGSFLGSAFPNPTRAETTRSVAAALQASKLDSPWLKRTLRLLRKLG